MSIKSIFGIKESRNTNFVNPARQSVEQVEDYAVKKSIATKELTTGKAEIGATTVSGDIIPKTNNIYKLGSATKFFALSYIAGLQLGQGHLGDVNTISSSSSIDLSIYSGTGKILKLGSNNTQGQVNIVSGDVGIGTAAPGEKLEVNGNIRAAEIYGNIHITDDLISDNANAGIDIEVVFTDALSVVHHLVFENGILVSYYTT